MKSNTVSRHQNIPNPASYRAFTLVELVVVIAILALVAAMSLPALCKTNIKSQGFQCMSNTRSLTAAWLMYSVENRDVLLSSIGWVTDSSASSGSTDFVDLNNKLSTNALSTYLGGNVKVYRCPADPRRSTLANHVGKPPARSYSMNNHIGHYVLRDNTYPYFEYLKMSDLIRPGPGNTLVILDESPTINDGWFIANMGGFDPRDTALQASSGFSDRPSYYHGRTGNFAFADGHGESHKWKQFNATTAPSADDVDWLQSKITAKITNPTR